MSISQNFSLTKPSLNLNFAKSQKLDSRITFTRTSNATRVNGDGYIELIPAGSPRFNFNPLTGDCLGLLIEEARTNLVRRSEEIEDQTFWGRTNCTVTTNAILSPDGTVDGDLVSNTGQVTSLIAQDITVPASSTTDYYVTIYAKKGTATYFTFNCYYVGNAEHNVDFNFDTQVVTGAPNSDFFMESVGNGWYRCGFRMNRDATGTRTTIAFRMWQSGRAVTSGNTYFWGAQLEVGGFPTSYIPTTTASVTRTGEIAQIAGTNFSNLYNPLEGTLYSTFRINRLGGVGFPGIVYVDDGTINNTIGFYVNDAGSDNIGFESYISNIVQCAALSSSAVVPGQSYKVAGGYKLNNMAASFSMQTNVQTDTVANIPTVNRMIIGDLRGSNSPLNGTISQLSYYPTRLSDSQLLTLTR